MNIKEIHLYTYNFEQQLEFYTQTLGFRLLECKKKCFRLQCGSSILQFNQAQNLPKRINYHFAFNIPQNQIKEAEVWVLKQGLEILPFQDKNILPFPNWNAEALYFLDKNSNIVELIARQDLDNKSTHSFSAQSICEISEIGLPVPNVKDFYEQMATIFEIPVYSRISNMTSFCASGNAQGLFIIVPLQRNWLPTKIENDIFPLKVILETENFKQRNFQFLEYEIESA